MAGAGSHTGLIPRIREFYEANPTELLTFADIAVKFGCELDQAYRAIDWLKREGLLTTSIVIMRREP